MKEAGEHGEGRRTSFIGAGGAGWWLCCGGAGRAGRKFYCEGGMRISFPWAGNSTCYQGAWGHPFQGCKNGWCSCCGGCWRTSFPGASGAGCWFCCLGGWLTLWLMYLLWRVLGDILSRGWESWLLTYCGGYLFQGLVELASGWVSSTVLNDFGYNSSLSIPNILLFLADRITASNSICWRSSTTRVTSLKSVSSHFLLQVWKCFNLKMFCFTFRCSSLKALCSNKDGQAQNS